VGFRPHWLSRFKQRPGAGSGVIAPQAALDPRFPHDTHLFLEFVDGLDGFIHPSVFSFGREVLKSLGYRVMMPTPDCSLVELGDLHLCALDA
jgi:hypothetical protein